MNMRYISMPLFALAALAILFLPVITIFGYSAGFSLFNLFLESGGFGPGYHHDEVFIVAVVMMVVIFAGAVINFSVSRGATLAATIMGGAGLALLLYFFFSIRAESWGILNPGIGLLLGGLMLAAALAVNIGCLVANRQEQFYGYPASPQWTGPVEADYEAPPPSVLQGDPPHALDYGEKTYHGVEYKPVLIGISGQYAGQRIDLRDIRVTIGRDPEVAHLIYDSRSEDISRRHCTLFFDDNNGNFVLEDYSSNGTFIEPNVRLAHGRPVYLNHGDRFYLVDRSDLFEVRLE